MFARLVLMWFLRRWGASPETLAKRAFGDSPKDERGKKRHTHVRVWNEDGELLAEVETGSEDNGV